MQGVLIGFGNGIYNHSYHCSYLQKTLDMLSERYSEYTPLVDIEKFVSLFNQLKEERKELNKQDSIPRIIEEQLKKTLDKFKESSGGHRNEDRIDVSI